MYRCTTGASASTVNFAASSLFLMMWTPTVWRRDTAMACYKSRFSGGSPLGLGRYKYSNFTEAIMTERQEVTASNSAPAQGKSRDEELVMRPPVDIFEDAHGIMVVAEMPGVSKEGLNV